MFIVISCLKLVLWEFKTTPDIYLSTLSSVITFECFAHILHTLGFETIFLLICTYIHLTAKVP